MREYTVTEAVNEVLSNISVGAEFGGVEFHKAVLYNLMKHGSPRRPMDSTTTRNLRSMASTYNIKCIDRYKSKYKKCM